MGYLSQLGYPIQGREWLIYQSTRIIFSVWGTEKWFKIEKSSKLYQIINVAKKFGPYQAQL